MIWGNHLFGVQTAPLKLFVSPSAWFTTVSLLPFRFLLIASFPFTYSNLWSKFSLRVEKVVHIKQAVWAIPGIFKIVSILDTMQPLSLSESKTIRRIIGLCLLLMMILFGFRQVYIKQRKFMPGGRKSKITFQEKVEAAYAAVSPCLTLADNFKPGKYAIP